MGYWSCHCDTFFIGNTKNVVAIKVVIKVVGIRIVKEIVTFRRLVESRRTMDCWESETPYSHALCRMMMILVDGGSRRSSTASPGGLVLSPNVTVIIGCLGREKPSAVNGCLTTRTLPNQTTIKTMIVSLVADG